MKLFNRKDDLYVLLNIISDMLANQYEENFNRDYDMRKSGIDYEDIVEKALLKLNYSKVKIYNKLLELKKLEFIEITVIENDDTAYVDDITKNGRNYLLEAKKELIKRRELWTNRIFSLIIGILIGVGSVWLVHLLHLK